MARVLVLCGVDDNARGARIDDRIAAGWGRAGLILPTRRQASARMEQLLLTRKLPGCFGRPVCEFNEFVQSLFQAEGVFPRMVGTLERGLLMESCLRELHACGDLATIPESTPSPGLARHLLSVITRLKQAEMPPEKFSEELAKLPGATPFDHMVSAAYTRYQAMLHETGLYDVPGLYWQACQKFAAAPPHALKNVNLLALDGFDDFTPSQVRLLEVLSRHVNDVVIGLHADLRPSRQDLFSMQAKTVERLREKLDITVIPLDPPDPISLCRFAANHFLDRETPAAPPVPPTTDLRLIPCMDLQHEVDTIARAAKLLIVEKGVPPSHIAIAFADFETARAPLQAALRDRGVPCRMRAQPSLQSSAVAAFVLRLLEAVADWPCQAVLDVLTSPLYRTDGASLEYTGAFPLLAREASITGGLREWRDHLQWLAQRLAREQQQRGDGDWSPLPLPDAVSAVVVLQYGVDALERLADRIPQTATLRGHVEALGQCCKALDMEQALAAMTGTQLDDERTALDRLYGLLTALYDLHTAEQTVSRSEFAALLRRALSETPWPRTQAICGVDCGDVTILRGGGYAQVFLGGMNEGVFPRPAAMNAVYTGDDIARLDKAGVVRLEGSAEHALRERLLFHHVLGAADRELVITWRLQQPDGKEALASPFVVELKGLLAPWLVSVLADDPRTDCLVCAPGEAACLRDALNAHAYLNLPGAPPELDTPIQYIQNAAAIENKRQDDSQFGSYDGVLTEADTRAWVAEHYGPDHHFSVSQLELYLACPYAFFERTVLGVPETCPPSEELAPLAKGGILHEAMEQFFRRFPNQSVAALMAESRREESLDALAQCLEQAFLRHEWRLMAIPPPMKRAELDRLLHQLKRFLTRHAKDMGGQFTPSHFEVSFGKVRGDHDQSLSTDKPFLFNDDACPVRLSGKIDRVDRFENQTRLVDYKTGAVPGGPAIYKGEDLQLTVYAWAAQELLFPECPCTDAWYCSLTKKEIRNAFGNMAKGKHKLPWENRESNARRRIIDTVRRIRAGEFPPLPANLKTPKCPESGRFSAARIQRKMAAMGLDTANEQEGGEEE